VHGIVDGINTHVRPEDILASVLVQDGRERDDSLMAIKTFCEKSMQGKSSDQAKVLLDVTVLLQGSTKGLPVHHMNNATSNLVEKIKGTISNVREDVVLNGRNITRSVLLRPENEDFMVRTKLIREAHARTSDRVELSVASESAIQVTVLPKVMPKGHERKPLPDMATLLRQGTSNTSRVQKQKESNESYQMA
jgi:hypothetical protein